MQPGLRTTKSSLAQALLTKKNKSGAPQTASNDVASEHPIAPLSDKATRLDGQSAFSTFSALPSNVLDLSFLSNASPIALFSPRDLTKSWWDPDPSLASTSAQNETFLSTLEPNLMPHQQPLDYQLPLVTPDLPFAGRPPGAPSADGAVLMNSAQESLLQALFSLGGPEDPPMLPNLTGALMSNTSGSAWLSPSAKDETESVTSDEDPEGVCEKLCSTLVLDKTVESNSLPSVLQSYAMWVRQTIFESLRMDAAYRT